MCPSFLWFFCCFWMPQWRGSSLWHVGPSFFLLCFGTVLIFHCSAGMHPSLCHSLSLSLTPSHPLSISLTLSVSWSPPLIHSLPLSVSQPPSFPLSLSPSVFLICPSAQSVLPFSLLPWQSCPLSNFTGAAAGEARDWRTDCLLIAVLIFFTSYNHYSCFSFFFFVYIFKYIFLVLNTNLWAFLSAHFISLSPLCFYLQSISFSLVLLFDSIQLLLSSPSLPLLSASINSSSLIQLRDCSFCQPRDCHLCDR